MGWGIEVLDLGEPTSSTGRTAPPVPGEPLPWDTLLLKNDEGIAAPSNPNPIFFQTVRAPRQELLEKMEVPGTKNGTRNEPVMGKASRESIFQDAVQNT